MSHAAQQGEFVTRYPYQQTPTRAHSRGVYILVGVVAVALGVLWLVANLSVGQFKADPNGVSMVRGTRPTEGETNVLPTSFVSAYLNSGHAINPDSLNDTTCRLFRAKDHQR